MKEFMPVITGSIINGAFLGVAIWSVKLMLSGFQKTMADTVNTLREAVKELKERDKELWECLNNHGHKGLEGEHNKVTR